MTSLPEDLSGALTETLARLSTAGLTHSVRGLIQQYREGFDRAVPAIGSEPAAAAYAAYRMPATYAAVHAALAQAAARMPGFGPRTLVDVGGGTGSAMWAAHTVWPTLREVTVLEQSGPAAALGGRLAKRAGAAAIRDARWQHADIDRQLPRFEADLVTMSYVLGELSPAAQDRVVRALAGRARLLVLVEPGTPEGYRRVVAARDTLIGLGLHVVAPCPHDNGCPIPQDRDWCHFAVRLSRSSVHRQIKDATLSFEDEKFSYVAASATPWPQAGARILRHPQKRKGLVSLRLCPREDAVADLIVSKRQGELYRLARRAAWGDAWPLGDEITQGR